VICPEWLGFRNDINIILFRVEKLRMKQNGIGYNFRSRVEGKVAGEYLFTGFLFPGEHLTDKIGHLQIRIKLSHK